MTKLVKSLAVITATCLFFSPVYSQLKTLSDNGLVADIKKVIDDHPYHFSHITGELILENPQSSDYQCNFKVEGAEETTITRYSSKSKNVFSWQAIMLTTDNFEDAKKKFKTLYTQLNGLSIRSSRLHGNYDAPKEDKKFSSILFSFDANDESFKKLKVELVLYSELLEWKIKLQVYDKEREDSEKGPIVED